MLSDKRMSDKNHQPTLDEITAFIGDDAQQHLSQLEEAIGKMYDLTKELRFPFGKSYGWGYKYSCKNKHLLHVFFAEGGLVATIQVGDEEAVKPILGFLSAHAQTLWENRYPCGKNNGGWVHYRIEQSNQLDDVLLLVKAKQPPMV